LPSQVLKINSEKYLSQLNQSWS